MSNLNQLQDLYNRPGWKLHEEYIKSLIDKNLNIIKNRTTPSQEVDFARGALSELEGLMDKVESEKSRQNRG